MSTPFKRAVLVCLTLVISGLAAELFLRAAGLPQSVTAGWKAKDHPASEYNQFGFRGAELEADEDDFVVVLLGDSFVECVSSPIDKIPGRLLEKELKDRGLPAKVVSLGARGYGQDQQLLALREYFESARADLVVLWVIPDNDVWNNTFRTHYGLPKPTFRLSGDRLIPPKWEWMSRLEPAGLSGFLKRFSAKECDAEWEKHLPEPYVAKEEPPVPEPNQSWQERWDEQPGYRQENFLTDRNHQTLHLEPRSERTAYGVRLTLRLLEEIQKLCFGNNADFHILYTQEWEAEAYNRPVDDLVWYELNGKYYGHSSVTFWSNLSELYDPFPRWAVQCTLEDWKVSETDLHFNQKANQQLMGKLAHEIVRSQASSEPSNP